MQVIRRVLGCFFYLSWYIEIILHVSNPTPTPHPPKKKTVGLLWSGNLSAFLQLLISNNQPLFPAVGTQTILAFRRNNFRTAFKHWLSVELQKSIPSIFFTFKTSAPSPRRYFPSVSCTVLFSSPVSINLPKKPVEHTVATGVSWTSVRKGGED